MDPTVPSPLLRSFERHLRAENRSDRTVATYLIAARQAEVFLAARGTALADADRADLETFLGDLLVRRAASTAATYHKVLKVLYRWLEEEEEITTNPMAKLRPPIIPEQPIPVVPEDGLRRLFAACAGKRFEDRRDTALLMLLLDTGARRAELAGLRLVDLDLELDVLLVLGARVAASGPCRSATRPRSPSIATCASVPATSTPSCRGCGSARKADSPSGAWS